MVRKLTPLILLLLLFSNCDNNTTKFPEDCAAVSCLANASVAYFMLINETTQENLLNQGAYSTEQIAIIDAANNNVNFTIKDFLDNKTLAIEGVNWNTGEYIYQININNQFNFTTSILLERSGGTGCCSNTLFIKNITTTGISSSFDEKTKISTIKLP